MSCARRAVVSAFLLLWPSLAFAQDAELRGVIKDQSGAIVPGASVTILAPTTGARRTITSDAAGREVAHEVLGHRRRTGIRRAHSDPPDQVTVPLQPY